MNPPTSVPSANLTPRSEGNIRRRPPCPWPAVPAVPAVVAVAAVALIALTLDGAEAGSNAVCPPRIQWDRVYGGGNYESLADVRATDRGFIVLGTTDSSDGQISTSYGSTDVWATLISTNGDPIWEASYGGGFDEAAAQIIALPDGGFVIGASSSSQRSGNKSSSTHGFADFWLLRLDATGRLLWDRSYGGSQSDYLRVVVPTSDGGFLLGGSSSSPANGNKTATNQTSLSFQSDYWIVRIDAQGNALWDRTYGGSEYDYLNAAVAMPDGGFLLGGSSASRQDGNKTTAPFGHLDFWLVRLEPDGDIVWQQSYGGDGWDDARSLSLGRDGTIVAGGLSYSEPGTGNKTSPNIGGVDWWVVGIDEAGTLRWDRSHGGLDYDDLGTVQSLPDGGFILGGMSASAANTGTKSAPWQGSSDFWVVRTDSAGQPIWDRSVGGLQQDRCERILPLAGGGFLLAGTSDSSNRGEKSARRLGQSDLWLVRLDRETPGDCDGDGVPDGIDLCGGTGFGDVADEVGCGLAQRCPCDSPWTTRSEYIGCLETNSARLVTNGAMTPTQRQALLDMAAVAECPPLPYSIVAFGLTNLTLGNATLENHGGESGPLAVSEVGPEGFDGISVRLGAADSGVFVSPYADIYGVYNEEWYMRGRAFGLVDGQSNQPISTLVARKPNYETYPVDIDFSPLSPVSVTWQLWSNTVLVAEVTDTSPAGSVTVHSSATLGPRANPFWRLPDGSVGAVIEFTEPVTESSTVSGPFGEGVGDRVVARANTPGRTVANVSSLDIVVGGGWSSYSVLDLRPGVFGRAHRVLGPGLLLPAPGRLTVENPRFTNESAGVLLEAQGASRLSVVCDPLPLTNAAPGLTFSLNGWRSDAADFLGSLQLVGQTNGVAVTGQFSETSERIDVKAYRNGILQGIGTATNHMPAGYLDGIPDPATGAVEVPQLIAIGGGLSSTGRITTFALTLDRLAQFRTLDGEEIRGDYFEFSATNNTRFGPLNSVVLFTSEPAVIITGEPADETLPPLAIHRADDRITLSWPSHNLPLLVESTAALPGGFQPVASPARFENGLHRLTLPASALQSEFFRLRRVP